MQNADEGTLRRSLALAARELDTHAPERRQLLATTSASSPGAPLVLLHPFSLCSAVWRPVLPLLQREHDVVTLDIPGHMGAEPLPKDFVHSVESAVDLLETKLDSLGIRKAHVVGNSLGGWFAIELARRNRALSVVALAPGGGWEPDSPEHRRLIRWFQLTYALLQLGGPAASFLGRYSLLRRATLSYAVARPESLSPVDATMFIESAWRCTTFGEVLKCMATQALPEPIDPLPCPMRLVWGSDDRLLPIQGYSERWRRVLPKADWVVLKDVGHVQMHDDPEAVARSILEITCAGPPTIKLSL